MSNQKSKRICIVIANDDENNKIYWSLADLLLQAGHSVTVLYTSEEQKNIAPNKNITIEFLPAYQGPELMNSVAAKKSFRVYQWLQQRDNQFDIVHVSEQQGIGYYSLLFKYEGLAFKNIFFCLLAQGPTLQSLLANPGYISSTEDLEINFLERNGVRLADGLVSLKKNNIDWMNVQQWSLPSKTNFVADEKNWVELHNEFNCDTRESTNDFPLVSICITHFNRPHFLAQTLESIYAQDYKNYEVILVDDHSSKPEALAYIDQLEPMFQQKGWKIIRNAKELFPAASRNIAVRNSRGKYILFKDDDNYGKSQEISTFVKVAEHTGADILTCIVDALHSTSAPDENTQSTYQWIPTGNAVDIGLFHNCFGDLNSLVRRTAFDKVGGFTETGIGIEDWEFFARSALSGLHMEVVPLPLFWHRRHSNNRAEKKEIISTYLHRQPYLKAIDPRLHGILYFAHSLYREESQRAHEHLQEIFDSYWNSRSWRVTRPFRKIIHILKGRPVDPKPSTETAIQTANAIRHLQDSGWWNMMGPFRVLGKIFRKVAFKRAS